jgi:hypothetical protein
MLLWPPRRANTATEEFEKGLKERFDKYQQTYQKKETSSQIAFAQKPRNTASRFWM